jgi:hypothetical protein
VFREDHTAHLLLTSVQHVTHAPRVPSGRPGHDRIVLRRRRQSIEAPTGRTLVRTGEVALSGAIDYFRGGSPPCRCGSGGGCGSGEQR